MKLVIGLGNPGEKYKKTRHNTGFMAIDAAASKLQATSYKLQANFNAEISKGTIDDEKIILAKPQTFMNESGKAVRAIADYYKINTGDIIVIHDDLDIPLGKYKIARDRASAGHKGVQSIIDALGTKDFARIRIGIGVKNKKNSTEAFVLENFSQEEQKIIDEVVGEVIIPLLRGARGV
ncbi:aminoacyl-tRNA hydrolase [Patescibacteria group bacterium]|nr:aminoacyl-tRNA hydrolase [Patescibacteria group bacterium]MBU4141851.1 aminoacyl-tRNA hydrolase [Patescibacteria group bacterium]